MKILRHALEPFRLALAVPLATAHGRVSHRHGVIVTLEDEEGREGYGEAAPLAGFDLESLAEACEALDRAAQTLTGRELGDLDDALDAVEWATGKAPCARAALDAALHDLAARRAGCKLAEWIAADFGHAPSASVAVSALVRAADPRVAASEALRAVSAGHRAVKLKLAAGGDDVARVAAVRAECPEDVELRLDANGAWSEFEARTRLDALAPFAPAFVEQPVAAGDLASLARVRASSPVPIAADESVKSPPAARRLLDAGAADLLVVKPAAVGGLRAARRIAALAREAAVPVVVTGFFDTALGTAAALALAAALPEPRPAGVEDVLAHDLAQLPPVVGGERAVPSAPGLGVELKRPVPLAGGDPS